VQGLRIRERLQVQYGNVLIAEVAASVSQMIAPLSCNHTRLQVPAGTDERHVVQPYHLPRQKYMNSPFQDNGQEGGLHELLPREGSSGKGDEMKIHSVSLQINHNATPPSELVENALSMTRGKPQVAPRRSGRRAPVKRRKTTSSSSEYNEEPSVHRTTQRISIPSMRSLRTHNGKTSVELDQMKRRSGKH
jgi:hypothetical protein